MHAGRKNASADPILKHAFSHDSVASHCLWHLNTLCISILVTVTVIGLLAVDAAHKIN
jgi:hypothetical protein